MTKESIIAFREKAKAADKQLYVWLDNALVFYENLRDCEVMIWNDDKELLYVIGPIRNGDSCYIKASTPYELYIFDYGQIQGMGIYLDYPTLINELTNFKVDGMITDEQLQQYITKLAPLSKVNTDPFTRTMRTYSDEDYKAYQESQKK